MFNENNGNHQSGLNLGNRIDFGIKLLFFKNNLGLIGDDEITKPSNYTSATNTKSSTLNFKQ